MNAMTQDQLFMDLTEDEQAALNGGYGCRYVYELRRVCYGFYCLWRYVLVIRCS